MQRGWGEGAIGLISYYLSLPNPMVVRSSRLVKVLKSYGHPKVGLSAGDRRQPSTGVTASHDFRLGVADYFFRMHLNRSPA